METTPAPPTCPTITQQPKKHTSAPSSVPFWIFPSWDIPTLGCHAIQCHLRIWGSGAARVVISRKPGAALENWRDEAINLETNKWWFRKLFVSICCLCNAQRVEMEADLSGSPLTTKKVGLRLGFTGFCLAIPYKSGGASWWIFNHIQWIPHVPSIETETGQSGSFKIWLSRFWCLLIPPPINRFTPTQNYLDLACWSKCHPPKPGVFEPSIFKGPFTT